MVPFESLGTVSNPYSPSIVMAVSVGGDPLPDAPLRIPDHFPFPSHCGIGDLRRFTSVLAFLI